MLALCLALLLPSQEATLEPGAQPVRLEDGRKASHYQFNSQMSTEVIVWQTDTEGATGRQPGDSEAGLCIKENSNLQLLNMHFLLASPALTPLFCCH